MQPIDILWIVLAVCILFVSIPLTIILWRAVFMMKRVESVLAFAERMVGYAKELESIPAKLIERFMK